MNAAGALAPLADLAPGFTPPAGTTAAPNSVAIANGIIAVAFEIEATASGAQEPGRVSFFDAASGAFLNSVEVGPLPDMLTFTADGTKVLVANEGEPNSYGQANSFDPEGSVSIIDLSGGVASATVQNAGFTDFNSQLAALKAAGVRIFGPGATVAKDLEPEYITVTPDGTTAVVTLQEANALAIAPTVIGTDRTPPTEVINFEAANVETGGQFDPSRDGIDFWESLEGMWVAVNNAVATSPTARFGSSEEIWVLADNGADATSVTARDGSLVRPGDFNPERIQIDDLLNSVTLPAVDVGARLSSLQGVVGYDFNNYGNCSPPRCPCPCRCRGRQAAAIRA